MASKNYEKEVKELARKKSNKNCCDCGRSGPQNNVVLDFNTFVCTSCAGLHRGFSHRVRSINMSNWTKPELDTLTHGGNKKAKKIWLATYTPEAYVVQADDEKNIQRFMTLVYDKKQWYDKDGALKADKKHKKKKEKAKEEDDESDDEEHSENHHPSSTPSHKSSTSDASLAASSTSVSSSHSHATSTPSHASSSHSSSSSHHSSGNATPTQANHHSEKKGTADVMDLLTSLDFSESTPVNAPPVQDVSFEASFDNGSAAQQQTLSPSSTASSSGNTPAMQQAISALTNSLKAVQSNFNLTPAQLKSSVEQALAALLGSSGGGGVGSGAATPVSPALQPTRPAERPVNKVQQMLASAQPTPPMPGAIALPGFGGGFGGGVGATMVVPQSSGNPFDDDFADDGGAAAQVAAQNNYYRPQQVPTQYAPQQYPQTTYMAQPQFQQQQTYVQSGMVQPGMVQPGMVQGYYMAGQAPVQMQAQMQPQQQRPKADDLFSFANPLH